MSDQSDGDRDDGVEGPCGYTCYTETHKEHVAEQDDQSRRRPTRIVVGAVAL